MQLYSIYSTYIYCIYCDHLQYVFPYVSLCFLYYSFVSIPCKAIASHLVAPWPLVLGAPRLLAAATWHPRTFREILTRESFTHFQPSLRNKTLVPELVDLVKNSSGTRHSCFQVQQTHLVITIHIKKTSQLKCLKRRSVKKDPEMFTCLLWVGHSHVILLCSLLDDQATEHQFQKLFRTWGRCITSSVYPLLKNDVAFFGKVTKILREDGIRMNEIRL